jgi:hypothetical protein
MVDNKEWRWRMEDIDLIPERIRNEMHNGFKHLKRFFAILIKKINKKRRKLKKRRENLKLIITVGWGMWSINLVCKTYQGYIFGRWIWHKPKGQHSKWDMDKEYG